MRARTWFLLGGITLIAAVLRFWHLGVRDIWTDEAISISIAQLPWHEFRRVITNREANAAFFELLLKLWTATFGTSETAVRSLSALAGILTIPLLFAMARRFTRDSIGLIAAAFLAVNAFHIRYSQEARGYALATLLVVISTWLFLRMREKRGGTVAYVIVSVIAIYTHMFAVFVIAAHFLSALFEARDVRRRALSALAAIAVLAAPLALFAKTKDVGQIAWIEPPSLAGIADTIWKMSGHDGRVLSTLFLIGVVAGAIFLLSRPRNVISDMPHRTAGVVLLCGCALLPFLLALLISLRKPIFLPRYLIVALPALLILIAVAIAPGVSSRLIRTAQVAIVVVYVALSLHATASFYTTPFDPPPQNWRALVQMVDAQAVSDDTVIFYHPYMRMPFEYARAREHLTLKTRVVFPQIPNADMMIAPIQQMDAREILTHPPTLRTRRMWLIRSSPPDATSEMLQDFLRRNFPFERTSNYGAGVDLFVYSRTASTPAGEAAEPR